MTDFTLDPRLEETSHFVCDLSLCMVRLVDDARFPWLMLVPRRAGLRDFHDVTEADKAAFHKEIDQVSAVLQAKSGAEKMNVGALGNMVPQLHVHIIARFEADEAWPGPVWGVGTAIPYDKADAASRVAEYRSLLA